MALREEAEHQGEELTPYPSGTATPQSHAVRLPVSEIAEAMGHSLEVHLRSYARFKPDSTAANYAAVNA